MPKLRSYAQVEKTIAGALVLERALIIIKAARVCQILL